MNTITTASAQWASRPPDERFVSLDDMARHFSEIKRASRAVVTNTRKVSMVAKDAATLCLTSPQGAEFAPTHFAFGQLATLAGAPAGYLRKLPAPIAADALNYGLRFGREPEEIGLLLHKNDGLHVRAATGPNYGRIWNADITAKLIERFGPGTREGGSDWQVPGEFGKQVPITQANTTLYAGDRDMFVFLVDEKNRITLPNRRNGQSGSLARGFFVWNSEVGSSTFGIATFLFDYVCMNRIIWGAENFAEVKLRHTSAAPERFIETIVPALKTYANASANAITDAVQKARQARLSGSDGALDKFLADRFGARMGETLKATHLLEESRPIESLWDVATAITAQARSITWQDERVAMERQAGAVIALASK